MYKKSVLLEDSKDVTNTKSKERCDYRLDFYVEIEYIDGFNMRDTNLSNLKDKYKYPVIRTESHLFKKGLSDENFIRIEEESLSNSEIYVFEKLLNKKNDGTRSRDFSLILDINSYKDNDKVHETSKQTEVLERPRNIEIMLSSGISRESILKRHNLLVDRGYEYNSSNLYKKIPSVILSEIDKLEKVEIK